MHISLYSYWKAHMMSLPPIMRYIIQATRVL